MSGRKKKTAEEPQTNIISDLLLYYGSNEENLFKAREINVH